jgi:hypothetical protein
MTLAYQEEEEQVIQALTLPMYMDVSTVWEEKREREWEKEKEEERPSHDSHSMKK